MTEQWNITTEYRQALRRAWRIKAAAQGLVCIICCKVPSLERREEFYDTGLCAACAGGDAAPNRGGGKPPGNAAEN